MLKSQKPKTDNVNNSLNPYRNIFVSSLRVAKLARELFGFYETEVSLTQSQLPAP
jgi:hypothetical protein